MTNELGDTKEKIALAATQLFIRRGFAGAPMSQISETCGIPLEQIQRNFENKEAILLYILRQLQASLREHVFSMADDDRLSQSSKLEKMNNLLKNYFLDNRGCLIAMMGMDRESISDESRQILNDVFQDWKSAYMKIFSKHHPAKRAEILATNAILFIEGAIIWLRVTGEEDKLLSVFEDIQQYLPWQTGSEPD